MEKNHKNPNCWSELPQDLVIKVFERLAFADFKRAKSVCSFWNSVSRQSVPKSTQVPWLILFPDDINNTSLTLFNPEEKDKLYKTQPLGVEIANSYSRATYRNWLLKQDFHWNLYIVNIFTHERINLPPMESQLGVTNVERTEADWLVNFDLVSLTYSNILIRSPVFWIDEKTKEYIVLYGLDQWSLAYSKTGDNFWNQVPEISDCNCMVYKDHKLYCISKRNIFTILDFSGQIPQQTFSILLNASLFLNPCILWKRLVLTITGDVLMIERVSRALSHINGKSIRIFKIYSSSSGFLEKHERVDSLGDETILLDLGITVLANKVEGLKRNSIYSSRYFCLDNNEFFIFNLETNKMEGLHKFDFDCSLAQWFLPSL